MVSFFLTLVQVLTDVAQPFLLMELTKVNESTGGFENESHIFLIGGIMMALSFVGLITGGFSMILSSKVGVRFGSIIRLNMLNKIQSLSFSDIDHFQTPSLITRLTNDIVFIQNTAILAIRIVARAILLFVGGVILAFVLSPMLALIFMFSCLVLLIIIYLVIFKAIPFFRKQQKEIDKTNSIMRENILGVRVVKAFNMQEDQVEKFQSQNKVLQNTSTTAQKWTLSIIPVILFLVQSSSIAVIMLAGAFPEFTATDGGSPQISVILSFTQIISLIVTGLVSMVIVLVNISSAKASSDRVNEVLKWNPSLEKCTEGLEIKDSSVEFKNVFFSYFKTSEESEMALKNISFKANAGETIGVIGATGSGKTTLVNLLCRMYDVSKGEILVSNINVKNINNESLRENISISPQKTTLFSGTIRSNLLFGKPNATEEEIVKACSDAQAIEFIEKKPQKFEEVVEQRGTNFSGGQKQRLSIARALIKKPKILILDDSTSALDLITEANVQKALKTYKNTTVFIIGQRISSISKADKIIVLDKGHMIAFGNHKDLMKNCKIYQDIAKSQEVS